MEGDLHIDRHISHRFNDELEDLRSKVLEMGHMAERQFARALEALLSGDTELARQVASSDYRINELEMEISAECAGIIARRQPAASDLRLLVSAIRMIADLERIGDEAKKIGRLVGKMADDRRTLAARGEAGAMGKSAIGMLRDALEAYAALDVEHAVHTAASNLALEQELESLNRVLITYMMEQPKKIKSLMRVSGCARSLERVGAHSVNICEELVYLVKGNDVRHLSLKELQQRYLPDGDSKA